MADTLQDFTGTTVLVCDADGAAITSEQDALDLIGSTMFTGAEWIALPVSRLPDAFFDLRTRLAGEVAQKFVNYRLGLAVIGDIAHHAAASTALADFVRETNKGPHLWFLDSIETFGTRLAA
ncbi:DUF4180 domain-containing protein [Yinghuangia seranimata]|uniref:DUF4180 domain-containing protein n=1 Tax=Yinghuangia seranimata TaxID=408067 RepID=UPI00248C671E|nr:DUF4180 domain-containing protein [Yinghuangia seranimata]MDI2128253.1 DUF4180 domain-containing protein [Yinghuangia seranimata]